MELTPQQIEGAQALQEHRQVFIQGANGVGKDTLTALWALFEVYVLGSLALLSGPSDRQTREILMRREVGRLWRLASGKLPGERYEMAIRIPGRERGGLLAFTAVDPDRWQGHHADRLFIGITEGSAVAPEIFEAAQGCMVGDGALLVVCNPTTPASAVHGFSRSKAWKTLRWSALKHINVITGEEVVPGAVTRKWIESVRREHGEESVFWRVRVLAEFPDQSEEALCNLTWIQAAEGRWADEMTLDQMRWIVAVDPARLGSDETVVAIGRGFALERFVTWRGADTMLTTGRVVKLIHDLPEPRHLSGRPKIERLVVDEPGLGGGVVDRLRELRERGYGAVEAFNGGSLPVGSRNADRYLNRRAEAFWELRTLLEGGAITLPADSKLREELTTIQWKPTSAGKIQIQSKDEIRRSIGRSCDRADAAALFFAPYRFRPEPVFFPSMEADEPTMRTGSR